VNLEFNKRHFVARVLFDYVLTSIIPGEPGLAGFIEVNDDGSGGDNWSYRTRKAPVTSSPSTNQQGRMPFLSPNQQCQSTVPF